MTFITQQQEKAREKLQYKVEGSKVLFEDLDTLTTSIIDTTLQAVEDRIKDEGLSIHGACDCLAELEEILKDLRK